ncbi:hypothetical protein BG015_007887 [Linnemannia schmuckeri]|uniref:Uncharacterized protein n=1 Tax=Linnemannia schmuckeri TaxID=64567 RepID=A0A9P5RYD8_9FUNG|nr:hypothetical protein BG015_007887 [Linnemannia schmuckeri]
MESATPKRPRRVKATTTATTKTTKKNTPTHSPPASTSATTVFAIPELAETIGRCLSSKDDLLHLSMTNRLLHQTVSPLFWSSLDLYDTAQARRLAQSKQAHKALSRNFDRIRELKIQTSTLVYFLNCMIRHPDDNNNQTITTASTSSTSSLSPLPNPISVTLPRLTRLTTLEYRTEKNQDKNHQLTDAYPEIAVMPRLTWLLNLNSSLTHIRVSGCRVRSPFDAHLFMQAIPSLKSLKELDLNFRMSPVRWEIVVELLFFSLPVSIEAVSLRSRKVEDSLTGPSSEIQDTELSGLLGERRALFRRHAPLDRLRRLLVEFGRWEDTRLLYTFLQDCPALETFSPPCWDQVDFRPISAALAQAAAKHCPRLRELDTCGVGTLDIIDALPQHSLTAIRNRDFFGSEFIVPTLQLISMKHYGSLTEVRIEECPHVGRSAIQAILWTCVALEHLIVKGPFRPSIRLRHLVEKDWVCARLKTLEITVELRQDIYPTDGKSPMPTVNELTWTLLRKLYRQLGALCDMEVLNLGIKSKELEWLDESGQERVGTVKSTIPETIRNKIRLPAEFGEDGLWSADEFEGMQYGKRDQKFLSALSADASFPGLLSLGDETTGRPGYLSWLSGWKKLRELRGHVQATTTETSKTLGRKELEWMLEHWPKLEVIELLPALKDHRGVKRHLLPMSLSSPHIVWFRQHRPDIHITQDSPSIA